MPRFLDSTRFVLRFSRKYTDQAINALLAARNHAAEHRREIDHEHILFGLANLPRGVTTVVLKNLGLDLGREIETITTLTDCQPLGPREGSPSLDTRAEQLLSRAEEHARGLGLDYVGSEHLVLGLLTGSGPSAEYFHGRGITPERFLTELKTMFASSGSLGQA
jgi:ATP-dependent Clp protease ATP-binding subunit ClpC